MTENNNIQEEKNSAATQAPANTPDPPTVYDYAAFYTTNSLQGKSDYIINREYYEDISRLRAQGHNVVEGISDYGSYSQNILGANGNLSFAQESYNRAKEAFKYSDAIRQNEGFSSLYLASMPDKQLAAHLSQMPNFIRGDVKMPEGSSLRFLGNIGFGTLNPSAANHAYFNTRINPEGYEAFESVERQAIENSKRYNLVFNKDQTGTREVSMSNDQMFHFMNDRTAKRSIYVREDGTPFLANISLTTAEAMRNPEIALINIYNPAALQTNFGVLSSIDYAKSEFMAGLVGGAGIASELVERSLGTHSLLEDNYFYNRAMNMAPDRNYDAYGSFWENWASFGAFASQSFASAGPGIMMNAIMSRVSRNPAANFAMSSIATTLFPVAYNTYKEVLKSGLVNDDMAFKYAMSVGSIALLTEHIFSRSYMTTALYGYSAPVRMSWEKVLKESVGGMAGAMTNASKILGRKLTEEQIEGVMMNEAVKTGVKLGTQAVTMSRRAFNAAKNFLLGEAVESPTSRLKFIYYGFMNEGREEVYDNWGQEMLNWYVRDSVLSDKDNYGVSLSAAYNRGMLTEKDKNNIIQQSMFKETTWGEKAHSYIEAFFGGALMGGFLAGSMTIRNNPAKYYKAFNELSGFNQLNMMIARGDVTLDEVIQEGRQYYNVVDFGNRFLDENGEVVPMSEADWITRSEHHKMWALTESRLKTGYQMFSQKIAPAFRGKEITAMMANMNDEMKELFQDDKLYYEYGLQITLAHELKNELNRQGQNLAERLKQQASTKSSLPANPSLVGNTIQYLDKDGNPQTITGTTAVQTIFEENEINELKKEMFELVNEMNASELFNIILPYTNAQNLNFARTMLEYTDDAGVVHTAGLLDIPDQYKMQAIGANMDKVKKAYVNELFVSFESMFETLAEFSVDADVSPFIDLANYALSNRQSARYFLLRFAENALQEQIGKLEDQIYDLNDQGPDASTTEVKDDKFNVYSNLRDLKELSYLRLSLKKVTQLLESSTKQIYSTEVSGDNTAVQTQNATMPGGVQQTQLLGVGQPEPVTKTVTDLYMDYINASKNSYAVANDGFFLEAFHNMLFEQKAKKYQAIISSSTATESEKDNAKANLAALKEIAFDEKTGKYSSHEYVKNIRKIKERKANLLEAYKMRKWYYEGLEKDNFLRSFRGLLNSFKYKLIGVYKTILADPTVVEDTVETLQRILNRVETGLLSNPSALISDASISLNPQKIITLLQTIERNYTLIFNEGVNIPGLTDAEIKNILEGLKQIITTLQTATRLTDIFDPATGDIISTFPLKDLEVYLKTILSGVGVGKFASMDFNYSTAFAGKGLLDTVTVIKPLIQKVTDFMFKHNDRYFTGIKGNDPEMLTMIGYNTFFIEDLLKTIENGDVMAIEKFFNDQYDEFKESLMKILNTEGRYAIDETLKQEIEQLVEYFEAAKENFEMFVQNELMPILNEMKTLSEQALKIESIVTSVKESIMIYEIISEFDRNGFKDGSGTKYITVQDSTGADYRIERNEDIFNLYSAIRENFMDLINALTVTEIKELFADISVAGLKGHQIYGLIIKKLVNNPRAFSILKDQIDAVGIMPAPVSDTDAVTILDLYIDELQSIEEEYISITGKSSLDFSDSIVYLIKGVKNTANSLKDLKRSAWARKQLLPITVANKVGTSNINALTVEELHDTIQDLVNENIVNGTGFSSSSFLDDELAALTISTALNKTKELVRVATDLQDKFEVDDFDPQQVALQAFTRPGVGRDSFRKMENILQKYVRNVNGNFALISELEKDSFLQEMEDLNIPEMMKELNNARFLAEFLPEIANNIQSVMQSDFMQQYPDFFDFIYQNEIQKTQAQVTTKFGLRFLGYKGRKDNKVETFEVLNPDNLSKVMENYNSYVDLIQKLSFFARSMSISRYIADNKNFVETLKNTLTKLATTVAMSDSSGTLLVTDPAISSAITALQSQASAADVTSDESMAQLFKNYIELLKNIQGLPSIDTTGIENNLLTVYKNNIVTLLSSSTNATIIAYKDKLNTAYTLKEFLNIVEEYNGYTLKNPHTPSIIEAIANTSTAQTYINYLEELQQNVSFIISLQKIHSGEKIDDIMSNFYAVYTKNKTNYDNGSMIFPSLEQQLSIAMTSVMLTGQSSLSTSDKITTITSKPATGKSKFILPFISAILASGKSTITITILKHKDNISEELKNSLTNILTTLGVTVTVNFADISDFSDPTKMGIINATDLLIIDEGTQIKPSVLKLIADNIAIPTILTGDENQASISASNHASTPYYNQKTTDYRRSALESNYFYFGDSLVTMQQGFRTGLVDQHKILQDIEPLTQSITLSYDENFAKGLYKKYSYKADANYSKREGVHYKTDTNAFFKQIEDHLKNKNANDKIVILVGSLDEADEVKRRLSAVVKNDPTSTDALTEDVEVRLIDAFIGNAAKSVYIYTSLKHGYFKAAASVMYTSISRAASLDINESGVVNTYHGYVTIHHPGSKIPETIPSTIPLLRFQPLVATTQGKLMGINDRNKALTNILKSTFDSSALSSLAGSSPVTTTGNAVKDVHISSFISLLCV